MQHNKEYKDDCIAVGYVFNWKLHCIVMELRNKLPPFMAYQVPKRFALRRLMTSKSFIFSIQPNPQ